MISTILLADLLPFAVILRNGNNRFELDENATIDKRSVSLRFEIRSFIVRFSDSNLPAKSKTITKSTGNLRAVVKGGDFTFMTTE